MPLEVLMPVITAAGDDGVVTAWFVDEGSPVRAGQLIAEVQAEKVAEEIEAPGDGFVRGLVAINDPVAQGAPICVIDDQPIEQAPSVPVAADAGGVTPATEERIVASPAAKRIARELGIDLAGVAGTGPGGRITEADVRGAAAGSAAPLTGLRSVIARNLRRSVSETAPVTLTTTVDVTDTAGARITPWLIRTVALTLADHPDLNGTREGDAFTPAETAHVALAIQTEAGLVAPVVNDPAAKSVDEIEAEVAELATRARAGELAADDYAGATFTVTNLGSYGIDAFTPIINLPQVAILGVGALRTVPGIDDAGNVSARRTLTLSLTFDHAFVDGAPAAEFLAHLRGLLEG